MTDQPLGIAGTRAALGSRELSATELADMHLAALRDWEPHVHAHIEYDDYGVRRAARAVDAATGVLNGLPVSVKDNIALRGRPMTAGSGWWSVTSRSDAECWSRLEAAGALLMGRTNMHEFAYGASTVNQRALTTRNPWNPDRIAGGSSGGSAVSVAVGAAVASLGTDTGGSVRIPAALTGVTGLKPTRGLVPTAGVLPLSPTCDHVGVLARSASDCLTLLACLAPGQVSPSPDPAANPQDDRPLRGVVLGLLAEHVRCAEDAVRSTTLRSVALLESLGAVVEEVELSGEVDAAAATSIVVAFEAAQVHRRWLEDPRHDYGDDVRARLERGRDITSRQYKEARHDRARLTSELLRRQEPYAAVVGPTVPISAPTVAACAADRTGILQTQLLRNTYVFNVTGQPAVSVPCGFDDAGLPVGLQLAAAPGQDTELLRLAMSFQDASVWHHAVPPRLDVA